MTGTPTVVEVIRPQFQTIDSKMAKVWILRSRVEIVKF
jgi:hypothetical protein